MGIQSDDSNVLYERLKELLEEFSKQQQEKDDQSSENPVEKSGDSIENRLLANPNAFLLNSETFLREDIDDKLDSLSSIHIPPKITLKSLQEMKQLQTLKQHNILWKIIVGLAFVQLLVMNFAVVFILIASYVNSPVFNDVPQELVDTIFSFMKYYISAVLVELLSTIIYIIRKVYSDDSESKDD